MVTYSLAREHSQHNISISCRICARAFIITKMFVLLTNTMLTLFRLRRTFKRVRTGLDLFFLSNCTDLNGRPTFLLVSKTNTTNCMNCGEGKIGISYMSAANEAIYITLKSFYKTSYFHCFEEGAKHGSL